MCVYGLSVWFVWAQLYVNVSVWLAGEYMCVWFVCGFVCVCACVCVYGVCV